MKMLVIHLETEEIYHFMKEVNDIVYLESSTCTILEITKQSYTQLFSTLSIERSYDY